MASSRKRSDGVSSELPVIQDQTEKYPKSGPTVTLTPVKKLV